MKPIMYTVLATKMEPLIVWQMREKDTKSFMLIFMPISNLIPLHYHLMEIVTDLYKSTHLKQWDVMNHACPSFKGGLVKPPLKLGYG